MAGEHSWAGNMRLMAGRLCLNFANTVDWHASDHPKEWLTSYSDLVAWSRHAGTLTGAQARDLAQAAKRVHARAAVTWPSMRPSMGPKGAIPTGLMREEYSHIREVLAKGGVRIVQGSRPLAPPSRAIKWDYPTPEAVTDKTLEVFGAGTKIAIEAAVMATNAGEVSEGDEVISCAGTYKGLDIALAVRAAYSMNFFTAFEVREVVAEPRCRIGRLPEYEQENWRGDLEKYYDTTSEPGAACPGWSETMPVMGEPAPRRFEGRQAGDREDTGET